MEMRQAFAKELEKIMELDERVCLIDADLAKATGTSAIHQKFPDRALNVGVAEANMASVAAGLSSYGFIPFISTFTAFATRRCFDQVAISIAYAQQNVKIVGTDPGIAAELNGGTHMSFEDIALMRAVPTMVVFEPVDEVQIRQALPQIIAHKGPVYMRMFRKDVPVIFGDDYVFDLFKADVLKTGTDVTILATGIMLKKALDAAEKLAAEGISAEVINVHTVKPLDQETILASVRKTGRVVTAENANVIGGLYSAVCDLLAAEYPVRVERVGVEDTFGEVGRLNELAGKFGLTEEAIIEKAKKVIGK